MRQPQKCKIFPVELIRAVGAKIFANIEFREARKLTLKVIFWHLKKDEEEAFSREMVKIKEHGEGGSPRIDRYGEPSGLSTFNVGGVIVGSTMDELKQYFPANF